MEGDEAALRTMLSRLSRAVTSGDGKAAAACWEVPALVLSDEGSRAVATLEEVAQFFAGAKAQYNRQGIADTRPEVEDLTWLTGQLASVTVRWPYLDSVGRDMGRSESSVYLVRVSEGKARICVAAMRGVQ